MEFNETTMKMLTDDPVGYLPPNFPESLRQAASLYSIAQIDAMLSTYATDADLLSAITVLGAGLALRAPIASPTFTGVPSAPTPATSSNDATIATTAFVAAKIGSVYTAEDVLAKLLTVDGPTSGINAQYLGGFDQSVFARLLSPSFSGNPTAPNQLATDVSNRIANTQLVEDKINLIFAVNFTPANILSLVKAADGTGSGLDADLWRGLTPAAFATPGDLTAYAPKASPALTGIPTAPTAAPGTNTTQLATTAFVEAETAPLAPIASPAFTGTPTAPTQTAGNNSTRLATTAFVAASFAPLSSPAFGGTPTAPTPTPGTNTTQLATTAFVVASFAPLASPTFTGTPLAPTPATADNTTKIATTAFVVAKLATIPFNDASQLTIGTLNDARLPSTMSPKTMTGLTMNGDITMNPAGGERKINFGPWTNGMNAYIYTSNANNGQFGIYHSTLGSIFQYTNDSGVLNFAHARIRANNVPFVVENSGTWNISISGLAANATNFGGQPTSYYAKNDGGTYSINITGRSNAANTLRNNGVGDMTFTWSGQAGQPSWLWGSNDGSNVYVWNPSNFSVAYAASAGSASSATTAGTASNSNNFGGQPPSYYAKNDGGTYSINITGGATNLNGQAQSTSAAGSTIMSRDGSGNTGVNRLNTSELLTNGLGVIKTGVGDAGEGISMTGGLFWIARSGAVAMIVDREGNDGQVMQFGRGKTAVGSISVNGSATSFNISSDERLKHDFQPINPALIDMVTVYDFAWNIDNSRSYGVKAQELALIIPQAVFKGDNPETDMWSVDYSKLVPLLIAKNKDLEARLQSLEARLAALEA